MELRRAAALTYGAAQLVESFGMLSWVELLDLLGVGEQDELLRRTQAIEESDSAGIRWPRNKKAEDATPST